MSNITQLYKELKTIGIPVVYNDFTGTKSQTPTLPFMAYYVSDIEPETADDCVWVEYLNVIIELYTTKRDITLEDKVKKLLKENGIIYDVNFTEIPEDGVNIAYFGFELIESQEE